jgi:nifR3 family TIM-barrel protein
MDANSAIAATYGAEPLRIGHLDLSNRVMLAPMSGVTDAPFRRLAARLGAGLVVSEMAACASLARARPDTRLRIEGQGIGLHVVQIAGCEAHWMAEGTRIAEGAGAQVIDINMGCPAKHVTNGASGSALMRDLDHALTLIDATVTAASVPVTLKMRLGWDWRSLNAPELARRAEAAGVRLITVHGRTRCQFYTGQADWHAIRAVKESITIPLVVNGDVTDCDEAVAALAASGADAVMIGRGAQGRPWLPGQVARFLETGRREPAPALEQQLALVTDLYDEMLTHHGARIGTKHARKHLGWAIDTAAETVEAPDALRKEWRTRVLPNEDPRAVRRGLADAFAALAWRSAA